VVKKPERVLNIDDTEIVIHGKIDEKSKQGIDIWIEIQRIEESLMEGQHIDYLAARTVLTDAYDYLNSHRHEYTPEINLSESFRVADVGILHHDAEEVAIGLTAFQVEVEKMNMYDWTIRK